MKALGEWLHSWVAAGTSLLRIYALQFVFAVLAWFLHRKLGPAFQNKGKQMLEGPEVKLKIGTYGEATVDLDDKLNLKLAVAVQVDLYAELLKLTKKTTTTIDDTAAEVIGKFFGRSAEQVKADHAAIVAA